MPVLLTIVRGGTIFFFFQKKKCVKTNFLLFSMHRIHMQRNVFPDLIRKKVIFVFGFWRLYQWLTFKNNWWDTFF